MRKVLIAISFILVCLITISIAELYKSSYAHEEREEEVSGALERSKEMIVWEEPWCLTSDDIDNDGATEIVLGVKKYKCNLWSTVVGVDIKWLVEMPLTADILLKKYSLGQMKLRFLKEIKIQKDADYIPPSKLEIKHFKIGDFNHDGLKEIFFAWDNGMKLEAKIIQIRGNKLRTLYSGPQNREEVELKDIDKDGKCEVLEKGLTWHIATEEEMEKFLKGHLFAIRIHKWNSSKKRWLPWKIVPDRETEKTLTREEVLEGIGAREILKGVPLKRLKELYPRAFK